MLVLRHFFRHSKAAAAEFRGHARSVGTDDIAGQITHHQPQWAALDPHLQGWRSKADRGAILYRLHFNARRARAGQDGPRGVLGKLAEGSDPNAENAAPQGSN